ncbi:hypothetical protein L5515_019247 [Caenorhabditis briggsae]|uniref:Uncharacterized protein n=1 Tax=Caenorhabditis briggsae TaxID=6238 RepID=A0AAE9FK05_CAEBR|nr:hypothetical protein L5515_019247 [Caenorhabditis briggsae]
MTPEHRKIWDVLRRSVKPNEIPDGSSAEVDAPARASSQDLIGCLNFSPCFAAPNSLVATSSVPSPSTSSSSVNPSGTSDRQKSLLSYSKIEAMKDCLWRSQSRTLSTDTSISPSSQSSSQGQTTDATAPQPSTSSSTTASTSQIASGDGRRRCRKREATPHPKEADKRSRN